jgi:hypothetical protein
MQYQTNYPYATSSQQYGAGYHPREEQRRRQLEYSQALAQQVAQREQQKRRERELDHQYGRPHAPQPAFAQTRQDANEPAERGLLDGLGRNNPQNARTNFARGQPQLHQRLPGVPEPADYPQGPSYPPTRVSYAPTAGIPMAYHQPPADNQGLPAGLNQQQSWQQQQPAHTDAAFGPASSSQIGWGPPNHQQSSMSQARSSQAWQGQEQAGYGGYASPAQQQVQPGYPQADPPLAHNGGRRQRTDIHDGGRGDSEDAERLRRKLQQQQEMQLALERQIEEKRQQKLQAKRRQEEEDRREMERFEEDKRRQRAEQERLQEEKRRKAEIDQQKAEQAAAAVAAANQQAKRQQQQKLHAQISQAQLQQPQHVQPFQSLPQSQMYSTERFAAPSSPSRTMNPFTNSRAHLFEDPPLQRSPQRAPMAATNVGYSNQHASPVRSGLGQGFPQENNVGMDHTAALRRQYDDMCEELRRQKQLVDQLRQAQAQIQEQQRSPKRPGSGRGPTQMDLERLRNELRGELAYREQLHRQELASLKREHQQERSPARSPYRRPGVKSSIELPVRAVERILPHQGQDARPRPVEDPIDESLKSLRGESKFVFFDGRAGAAKGPKHDQGDALDERSESVEVDAPRLRRSFKRSPTKQSVRHSTASSVLPSFSSVHRGDTGTDSEDEADDFVVAKMLSSSPLKHKHQVTSSPTSRRAAASSHRYSQLPRALTPRSPSNVSGTWRLESVGTNDASDSDDELDASLDGEQLEALFQRNVRRHEILLGFQCKVQAHPQDSNQPADGLPHATVAWSELHQQLESNRRTSSHALRRKLSTSSTSSTVSSPDVQTDAHDEAALVASSRWMPSSLLTQTEQRGTRGCNE